ncbi:hypothetical protein DFS33DRAFT_1342343 [Desarmillaria ectypa]|nr:hypothetical protein DFS33DRAFT_1342343 [Desarmillaria ectypa]
MPSICHCLSFHLASTELVLALGVSGPGLRPNPIQPCSLQFRFRLQALLCYRYLSRCHGKMLVPSADKYHCSIMPPALPSSVKGESFAPRIHRPMSPESK